MAVTAFHPYGGPGIPYGSFAGKTEQIAQPPLGAKLDEFPRLPSDPFQLGIKVTDLFSRTNTRVNELSTGSLWANYNASAAKPASTEGAWGDQRKNSRPVELGSPGSKYVVIGWVRLETDWADCRVITGN